MNHSQRRVAAPTREITCTGRAAGLPVTSRRWRSPWRRRHSRSRSPWRSCGGRAGREGTWSPRPAHLSGDRGTNTKPCVGGGGVGGHIRQCVLDGTALNRQNRLTNLHVRLTNETPPETRSQSQAHARNQSRRRERDIAAKCLACKTEPRASLRETTSAQSNTAHLGLFLESVNNRWLTRKRIPSVALSNGGLALFLKHKKENTTKKHKNFCR